MISAPRSTVAFPAAVACGPIEAPWPHGEHVRHMFLLLRTSHCVCCCSENTCDTYRALVFAQLSF